MMLLNDPEWKRWSDREIARRWGQIKQSIRTVQRNGRTYQQNTRNIGHATAVIERAARIGANGANATTLINNTPSHWPLSGSYRPFSGSSMAYAFFEERTSLHHLLHWQGGTP